MKTIFSQRSVGGYPSLSTQQNASSARGKGANCVDSASAWVLEFVPQSEAQASRLLAVRESPVVSANGHVNASGASESSQRCRSCLDEGASAQAAVLIRYGFGCSCIALVTRCFCSRPCVRRSSLQLQCAAAFQRFKLALRAPSTLPELGSQRLMRTPQAT